MDEVLQQVKQLCQQHKEVRKVVLFGSRARGTHNHRSDYDIAIYFANHAPKHSLLFHELDEIHCLHKIDILAVSEETSALLLENIQKEGVVLLERHTKLENYSRAVGRLKEAVELCQENPCPFYFDALIQRFEFSTELAWKTCKEHLEKEGFTEVNSPKSVMKQAFSIGLLGDAEVWLSILTDRNRTSHIYDETTSKEIAEQVMTRYLPVFEELLNKLQQA